MTVIKFFVGFVLFMPVMMFGQTNKFGFGCLGLVGGFAGYEVKYFQSTGLNGYVAAFNASRKDSLLSAMSDFGMLKGYRLGMNLVRNRVSGLEYTVKVFYEAMTELKEAQIKGKYSLYKNSLELKQTVFGAGLELGTPISKLISWKILELEATYGNAVLFKKTEDINDPVSRIKYTSDQYRFGFNFASGFIFYLIGQNISLEGKMGYAEYSIGTMTDESGNKLTVTENSSEVMESPIQKGGLFYGVQFNLSIPL